MPDVRALLVLALTAALIAVLAGLSRSSRETLDLRITKAEVSSQMLEVIPGVTPALGTRIRGLSASGYPLDEAISRLLPPDHAQRFSTMVKGAEPTRQGAEPTRREGASQ